MERSRRSTRRSTRADERAAAGLLSTRPFLIHLLTRALTLPATGPHLLPTGAFVGALLRSTQQRVLLTVRRTGEAAPRRGRRSAGPPAAATPAEVLRAVGPRWALAGAATVLAVAVAGGPVSSLGTTLASSGASRQAQSAPVGPRPGDAAPPEGPVVTSPPTGDPRRPAPGTVNRPIDSPAPSRPPGAPPAGPIPTRPASPLPPAPPIPGPVPTPGGPAADPLPRLGERRCPQPAAEPGAAAPIVTGRTVALTFDDGPVQGADGETAAVLDVLAAQRVPATFFVLGRRAVVEPDLLRRTAAEGHLLAAHSWDHRYPREVQGGWTQEFVTDQMSRTADVIETTTGQAVCYLRPPGGFMPPSVMPAATALRMSVVLWSVDTLDWKVQADDDRTPPEQATLDDQTDRIVERATTVEADDEHPVVLLHDGGGFRGATVAALPRIIEWYRERGYTFVRVDGTN